MSIHISVFVLRAMYVYIHINMYISLYAYNYCLELVDADLSDDTPHKGIDNGFLALPAKPSREWQR